MYARQRSVLALTLLACTALAAGCDPNVGGGALQGHASSDWTRSYTLAPGGELQVVAALCAVVGATRSVWVGFKGGRGIATGFGTALAVAPLPLLAASPVFFAVILATRLVSAGSLAAAAAFAPLMIGSRLLSPEGLSLADAAYAIVGPALVWVAHADNIARLREGTERRFDLGLLRRD